jgi:hypothetical protein
MSWNFKCSKENSRRKNNNSLNQSSNDFYDPFIELAEKNNRQSKPNAIKTVRRYTLIAKPGLSS